MRRVDAEHTFEVAATNDEQPVETLGADSADEALGVGVRLWCADWCLDHRDAFAAEDLVEGGAELAVAITNQETDWYRALGQRTRELARLLGYPTAVGMRGAAGKVHASSADFDEEEHVQASEPERLDGEEMAGWLPHGQARPRRSSGRGPPSRGTAEAGPSPSCRVGVPFEKAAARPRLGRTDVRKRTDSDDRRDNQPCRASVSVLDR